MNPLGALTRFVQGNPGAVPETSEASEPCEICRQPLGQRHRHVLDLERRTPCCVCVACALLFSTPREGARYQTLGDRVLVQPGLRLGATFLEELAIPVRLAFITSDPLYREWVATYPSVGGPTRAPLPADRCAELTRTQLVRALVPGLEALLLYGRNPGDPLECFGVAVDRCYALVGTLRRQWRGFSGGEVWGDVEAFFNDLRGRARPVAELRGATS
jgi:hypothetical protein